MNRQYILSGRSSLFLDGLRLCAALTVLVSHAYDMWFPYNSIPLAHTAVVIFFALSGYVIAYTTKTNNRGPIQYAQARLSRLYSILIPAIIITGVIELTIKTINPEVGLEFSRGVSWPRYVLCSLFINEIWFLSAAPPVNIPLWSLSFEFWYYVIFGLFFFRRGNKLISYFFPILACLIAGPKILLMMPVWLAGYVAYNLPRPIKKEGIAWCITLVLILIAVTVSIIIPSYPYKIGENHFNYANQFLSDYATSLFIVISLWCLPTGFTQKKISSKTNLFRRLADLTFSIYVLHYPIILLIRSLISFHQYNYTQLTLTIIVTVIISSIIGYLLESRKNVWTNYLSKIIIFCRSVLIKSSGTLKYTSRE